MLGPSELQECVNVVESVHSLSFDGILAFDRERRYLLWNQAMERITGYKAEDVIGRNAFELFPFLQASHEQQYRQLLEGKACICRGQKFEIAATGRHGYYDASYGPLFDKSGQVVGGIGVVREVTQRIIAEKFSQPSHPPETGSAAALLRVQGALLRNLGKTIWHRRKLLRMSQDELGQRSGLHRTYISDIERGMRNLAMENLVRLSDALQVAPWVLIAQAECESESSN